jgi:hypothetical protein
MSAAFALLATYSARAGWGLSLFLAPVSLFFLLSALWFPKILRPLEFSWMKLATVLNFVMTRLILGILFYLIITPVGLLMRLTGNDPITKHPDPTATTYWTEVKEQGDISRMF